MQRRYDVTFILLLFTAALFYVLATRACFYIRETQKISFEKKNNEIHICKIYLNLLVNFHITFYVAAIVFSKPFLCRCTNYITALQKMHFFLIRLTLGRLLEAAMLCFINTGPEK